jgi:hypothetical protein
VWFPGAPAGFLSHGARRFHEKNAWTARLQPGCVQYVRLCSLGIDLEEINDPASDVLVEQIFEGEAWNFQMSCGAEPEFSERESLCL